MKKLFCVLLSVLLIAALFGCGKDSGKQELWIVTEQTTWDRMNGQTWILIDEFEKTHDITVNLDILPTQAQERSVYLQQLRTQILRGSGPDAYLLPTSTELVFDAATGYTYETVEPLFPDVRQAMENGIFLDISDLYDADDTLGKENLLQVVMDAGVLGSGRYVLPLRYDIPVIYADARRMEEAGLSPELLEQGILPLMAAVAELQDMYWANSAAYAGVSALGDWENMDTQTVELTAEQIREYFALYQELKSQVPAVLDPDPEEKGDEIYVDALPICIDVKWYVYGGYEEKNGFLLRYPMHIGSLSALLEYAPVYQYEGNPLYVVPMRSVDGLLTAQVTYYAAVGSGCDRPELVYELLRQFLLEDSQFEENRPQSKNAVGEKGRKINTTNSTQRPGPIEEGWPVRSEGSLNPLWRVRRRQFYLRNVNAWWRDRMRNICFSDLDEGWAAVLGAPIDRVTFGTGMADALEEMLGLLNDPETHISTDADAGVLSQRLFWQMRLHLGEG